MMLLTALGQGLYLLAGPFIGRIYSPEQIGYFGLFVTMWTVLALFAGGLYDIAIPSTQSDDEARRLSGVAVGFGISTGVITGALLSIAAWQQWLGLGVFPVWAGAVFMVAMVTQTAVQVAQGWALRANEVLVIGKANVLMNGLRSVFQVLGGLFSPLWATMVAAEILARLAQARRMFASKGKAVSSFIIWGGYWSTVRRHRRFPFVFGPAFVLDSVATLLQTSMVGILFGPAEMGQFFLMRRTLDLPVAFAFKSLSDVFFTRQLAMARDAPERLRPFFLRSGAALVGVGVLASLPLVFFGSELFRFFYGPNWGLAGYLATIIAPAMVANLAVAPVARVFQLSEKSYLRLVPGVLNVTGSLLVLWAAQTYKLSLVEMTAGISITIAITFVAYFAAGYFVAGHVSITTNDQDRG